MTDTDSPYRASTRTAFLAQAGFAAATLDPLPVDASFRRYFRLHGGVRPMLLMDAPPPKEDVRPFIRIARHLTGLGLSAPAIYEFDEAEGFALIEDFGEATYTRLLDAGAAEGPLFLAATEALVTLHTHPNGTGLPSPAGRCPPKPSPNSPACGASFSTGCRRPSRVWCCSTTMSTI